MRKLTIGAAVAAALLAAQPRVAAADNTTVIVPCPPEAQPQENRAERRKIARKLRKGARR